MVCLADGPSHPKQTHLATNFMSCISMLESDHEDDRVMEVLEASQGYALHQPLIHVNVSLVV